MEFHYYIDIKKQEILTKITDDKEKQICENILENGTLNFCQSIYKRKKKK